MWKKGAKHIFPQNDFFKIIQKNTINGDIKNVIKNAKNKWRKGPPNVHKYV